MPCASENDTDERVDVAILCFPLTGVPLTGDPLSPAVFYVEWTSHPPLQKLLWTSASLEKGPRPRVKGSLDCCSSAVSQSVLFRERERRLWVDDY